MNISDALAYLQHVSQPWSIRITASAASVYIRKGWAVRVRAKGCESIEKMVIRLALKAQMQEQFAAPPRPRPQSHRSKAHLRRLRRESLSVN